MSHLKPIASDYVPAYPRELAREEIQDLLRPSLLKRFSQKTLAAGAMITGMAVMGCQNGSEAQADTQASEAGADVSPPDPAVKRDGPTTSSDPNLKKKVDAIVAEVLGKSKKGFWYERSSLELRKELKSNPPVKYPVIPISYGNSCVGIFDHATAREATIQLFEAYGIELKMDVALKGEGYEFAADGYNSEQKVGFELIMPQGHVGFSGKTFEKEADAKRLEEEERQAISDAVAKGSLNVLVLDAEEFPNMDNDLYTPMEYYLGSVVDYLNWLHGDKQIDKDKVLGKFPGRLQALHDQVEEWQKKYPTLPNCDFETAEDLKPWTVEEGFVRLGTEFSGNLIARQHRRPEWFSSSKGENALICDLHQDGKATYTVPEGQAVRLIQKNVAFACRAFWTGKRDVPEAVPPMIKIVLRGTNGKTWEVEHTLDFVTTITSERDEAPFEELRSIEISVKGGSPVQFYVDDLGLSRE